MPENNLPKITEVLSNVIPYLYFIMLGIWGGTVNYLGKLKKSGNNFYTKELIGEVFISGFSGLISAYLCVAAGFPFAAICAASGIAGHMGGKTFDLIEAYIKKKYFKLKECEK